jgi:serine/threonine protein kinase
MTLQQGDILNDRYRIDGRLGKGGMGAVYLAFDQTLNIKVALKENLNLNPESERQFKREASLLAGLRHPNLPRVTDHFILEGRQYLVMDFIEGEDLHQRTKQHPPTVDEVIDWVSDVADALSYLHSRTPPIIHRDIKPANIKLQPDGNVVLVDFGLAKIFDHQQTTTGARGLTPGYSPPEQYGSGRTDSRSDQYALAATTYALLTGKAPVDSIERMMGNEELTAPRQLKSDLPEHVDEALSIALSINKEERFPDIKSFASSLRGEVAAKTVMNRGGAPVKGRRWWVWALAGGGILGLVALLLGLSLVFGGDIGAILGGANPSPTSQGALISAASETPEPTRTDLPTRQPTTTATESPTATAEATEAVALLGGGRRLAFVSDREDGRTLQIWTMLPDGTDPVQLTFGPGNKQDPSWSPDGERLLFVAPGGTDEFGNDLGADIWLINKDGTGIKNISHTQGEDIQPEWSPDGSSIVFTSNRINELNQVFTMPTACFDQAENACWQVDARNLSRGFAVESSPAWSPDGGTIAVSASINGAPGRIFLRSPFPSEPTMFDRSDKIIGAEELAFSPGGELLVFTWVQPSMNEIYLVRLAESVRNPVKLTNSLGNGDPDFSPDGQWIALTSTRDQNPEIYLMTANGSNQTNLTQSPTSRDLQPDWQP